MVIQRPSVGTNVVKHFAFFWRTGEVRKTWAISILALCRL